MPRKANRRAAKFVERGGRLWDRRRVARSARKHALANAAAAVTARRGEHLDKRIRIRMLGEMVGWSFDHRAKAFVANDRQVARIEELISAVVALGDSPVVLRVSGLSFHEAARVRGYLGPGSRLVPVNLRTDGLTFV